MSNKQLVSIHAIGASDPAADMIFTGKYDRAGDPLMKKATVKIPAGAFFNPDHYNIDDAEIARLVELGAARFATENEMSLGRVIRDHPEPYSEIK